MTRKHPLDWLSYPRGILLTVFGALWTMLLAVLLLGVIAVTSNRRVADFVIDWLWAWPLIWLSGVRLEVRGREHVRPTGPGRLLVFNHSSLFDILVLYAGYPRTFRYGAKIELFKIPIFGTAMRRAGVLPIDRGNRQNVMKVYEAAVTRVRAGESFALAPEGTRQLEAKLGPFKRGPFEFAINAGADLQPVVIAGAFEVLPRNAVWINQGRWRRTVILDIGPPVPTVGLTTADAPRLQAEVFRAMSAAFAAAHAQL